MKRLFLRLLAALVACAAFAGTASAAGTCSITSVAFTNQTYTGAALSATGTVNWTCTRTSNGADGSPTTFNVTAGPGLQYAAGSRNVANGATMAYGLTSSAVAWGDGVTAGLGADHVVTAAFANGGISTVSGNFTFAFTIGAGLNPLTGRTYSDTIAIGGTCTTSKASGCIVTGSNVTFTVDAPTNCALTPPPNVALVYAAFQTNAAPGNSPFTVNCGNGAPYRMSVSPTSGAVLGIAYTLKIGTVANSLVDISSTTTYNQTGTGGNASYFVNASAAAGQPGTCATGSCTQNSAGHTLLIEY